MDEQIKQILDLLLQMNETFANKQDELTKAIGKLEKQVAGKNAQCRAHGNRMEGFEKRLKIVEQKLGIE